MLTAWGELGRDMDVPGRFQLFVVDTRCSFVSAEEADLPSTFLLSNVDSLFGCSISGSGCCMNVPELRAIMISFWGGQWGDVPYVCLTLKAACCMSVQP